MQKIRAIIKFYASPSVMKVGKVWIKNRTEILLNITKVIALTVKTQGQNDLSKASK